MSSIYVQCHPRSILQDRLFELVSRLHDLTSRLNILAGHDRKQFNATITECDSVHAQIAESRSDLQAHRGEHGC